MQLDINTYFLSKFSFHRSPSCRVALHEQLFDTVNVININNRNKLQLIQIIRNVMLYSQKLTFHWKLLVLVLTDSEGRGSNRLEANFS